MDENEMMKKIKNLGEEIFNTEPNTILEQESFDFSLSESELNESQIRTFINKPLTMIDSKKKPKYAIHYLSPYSKRSLKQPNTSRTILNHHKTTIQIKNRLSKIQYDQHQLEKKRKQRQNLNQKGFRNEIKSKYLKEQPMVKNFDDYVQKNFYKRPFTEHSENRKKYSREESEEKWNSFIEKTQNWNKKKFANVTKARIDKVAKINEENSIRPEIKKVPKLSIEECLGKLRRQRTKLKEQLQSHRFEPILYHTERTRNSSSKSKSKIQLFQKINEKTTQKKIPKLKDPLQELKFMIS